MSGDVDLLHHRFGSRDCAWQDVEQEKKVAQQMAPIP